MQGTGQVKELVASMVRAAVAEGLPGASGSEELEAVVSLCLIGVHRTGSEDPAALAARVSDPLLEHLVSNADKLAQNRALAGILQLLVLEWCGRNGYLLEDWRWEWVSRDEGRLHYQSKIPLEDVPLPKPVSRNSS